MQWIVETPDNPACTKRPVFRLLKLDTTGKKKKRKKKLVSGNWELSSSSWAAKAGFSAAAYGVGGKPQKM